MELVSQVTVLNDRVQTADIVLPGATSMEKDASYNDHLIVQAVARVTLRGNCRPGPSRSRRSTDSSRLKPAAHDRELGELTT